MNNIKTNLIEIIANEKNLKKGNIINVINLLEDGSTVAFISRYRKEMTGSMNDEDVSNIKKEYSYLLNLEERKAKIIELISNKGKISDDLINEINNSSKLVDLEDIYRPFKDKKKTFAGEAIQKGLQPLADFILKGKDEDFDEFFLEHVNDELKIDEVIEGVKYIIAEIISDDPIIRKIYFNSIFNNGFIEISLKSDDSDDSKIYKNYYGKKLKINKIYDFSVMAINRGVKQKALTTKFIFDASYPLKNVIWEYTRNRNNRCFEIVLDAINDGVKRLLIPSIQNKIWSSLLEKAQNRCIDIFSNNLENILLQAPLKDKNILAIDPAYKTGCKYACLDKFGKLLNHGVIYPTKPHEKIEEARKILVEEIKKFGIDLIVIGNGTASRETELFVSETLKGADLKIPYSIVNEAGASVYSASETSRKEFPELNVEHRSAISIGRRIIDPLSELIKISPESIGVGQYQHDISKKDISDKLEETVEKIVNHVGIDINKASLELLKKISGINETVANSIINYRETVGKLTSKKNLLEVPKVSDKIFEQASGFIRVMESDDILDATSIHPESFEFSRKLINEFDLTINSTNNEEEIAKKITAEKLEKFGIDNNVGIETLKDIIEALKNPTRDYRENFHGPMLRYDILNIKDLKVGTTLSGVVRNIVDFGAYIDIGCKNNGMIHTSKMGRSDRNVDPNEVLSIGEIVQVEVIEVDTERNRISLQLIK